MQWPAFNSFNGGEISRLAIGRTDFVKVQSGLEQSLNFIPLVEGPVSRRGGTRHAGLPKLPTARLKPFRFNADGSECYCLEFGDSYVRVWQNGSRVGSVEVATPWDALDLVNPDGTFALQLAQAGDVVYITHRRHQTRKLARLSHTSWTLSLYEPVDGPFGDPNRTTISVWASGTTGTVTLRSVGGDAFFPEMVGGLFWLQSQHPSKLEAWQPGENPALGVLRRVDRRVYELTAKPNNNGTGVETLIHEEGIGSDGNYEWTYRHSGFGVLRITGYTSASQVTALVLSTIPHDTTGEGDLLPADVAGSSAAATTRWAAPSWNDRDGYPSSVAFWNDRLWFGHGYTLYASASGDYESHAARIGGQVLADSAIIHAVVGTEANAIQWLSAGPDLRVGTAGAEFLVQEITKSEALGPANVQSKPYTFRGSRPIQPARVGSFVLFADKTGRSIQELGYSFEIQGLVSSELSKLSRHLFKDGILDLAYQEWPDSVLWAIDGKGQLRGLTYSREHEVFAGFPARLGGFSDEARTLPPVVESLCVLPTIDGASEELWLLVRRWINGNVRRHIEVMQRRLDEDEHPQHAKYTDGALELTGFGFTNVSAAAPHLAGETVQVLADGAYVGDVVVSSIGSIDWGRAADRVQVGLGATARLKSLRMEVQHGSGSTMGRVGRINAAIVRFIDTIGGWIGTEEDRLDEMLFREASLPFGSVVLPQTGDHHQTVDSRHDRLRQIIYEQRAPLPVTIAAIMPEIRMQTS